MEEICVLYNPLAGCGTGKTELDELKGCYPDVNLTFVDMTKIASYEKLFKFLGKTDIIVCGGDGTLNRFINDTADIVFENDIYYYGTGSGNDFLNDLEKEKKSEPFKINKYLPSLPYVTVNGRNYKFINGIGFGLDGFCCEEGDNKRDTSKKPVNYAAIALKGLLWSFKPVNAKVVADGKEYRFRKVWLAPSMKGRFYGGGIMMAPNQDRLSSKTLSFVAVHSVGRIGTLLAFPLIFKGKHIRLKKIVTEIYAGEISVEFDRPCALQIDGETIKNVTSYSVSVSKKIGVKMNKEGAVYV